MTDLSASASAGDVFDKLACLQALLLAEGALANEGAAREEDGASLFSDSEQAFLHRMVEEANVGTRPGQSELDQLFELFRRAAESPHVAFPLARLKEMLRLSEATNAERGELPVRHRSRAALSENGRATLTLSANEAAPPSSADADRRQPPFRRRSRPLSAPTKIPKRDDN